jgi:purine-binding chemotaxis protein CheW
MSKWNGNRPLEVLTLEIEGEMFAVEAPHVREILDLVSVTEVPLSQPFVNALINVRGRVVPLADLRVRFGMPQRPPTIDTRIVVVDLELDGEKLTTAIRADKVYEVTELTAASLQDTPKVGLKWRPEFVRCIGKRGGDFIVVLDLAAVFSVPAQAPGFPAHSQRNEIPCV